MSVEKLLDTLTEWAQVNICDLIQLKQPPMNEDAPEDERYKHTLVRPTAFPMYIPTPERLPPNIHSQHPCLCVGFAEGEDEATKNNRVVTIQLSFAAWNPGEHGRDVLLPDGKGGMKEQTAAAAFKRNADGWRDVWRFVDIALRAVESITHIDGYIIDRATPVKFGPLADQTGIPDLYPYWFAWVTFKVVCPLRRNIPSIQNML